jgi:signal transduction histidine kinase
MGFFPQSLYFRLVLLISLILGATVITYSWVTSENQAAAYQATMLEHAVSMTANLAETSANYLVVGDYAALEHVILRSVSMPNLLQLQVCEPDGVVVANAFRSPDTNKPTAKAELRKISVPTGTAPNVTVNAYEMVVWHPIVAGSQLGWVRATFGLQVIKQMRVSIWQHAIALGAVWIFSSIALLLYLLKRPARAVGTLSEFARQLVDSRGKQVNVDPWSDEIRQLGISLNHASLELHHRDQELTAERQQLVEALKEVNRLNMELERRVATRTAALEISNRELESFCYSVSHDLRAPLRHIDGYCRILHDELHEGVSESGKMYLERARKATQKMGELIDDLLQLSRITRSELNTAPVNLSEMVHEIANEFTRVAPERNVRFEIEEGIVVNADANLIKIAMDNILGNAWKYTAKQPDTVIAFGRAHVSGKDAVFVRDNGAGFDMRYADKLFGAFQRLHSVEEFEGTGVGLATVMRIISRHGGDVWGEGEVGKGATFYFTVPG